jgi:hypothetical protein
MERAGERRDIFWHTVRDRLACVALVVLVLVAMMMSPIPRSSASQFNRPTEGLRCYFALPAFDSCRLSVTASIMLDRAVVTVWSEGDEKEDEQCSATRQAYETYDPFLSPPRRVPTWNLAVPSPLAAPRPLRC